MVGIILEGKVGEKGQVVIPKPLRNKFGITKNTELLFEIEDLKIVIRTKSINVLEQLGAPHQYRRKLPKNIDWDEWAYSGRR